MTAPDGHLLRRYAETRSEAAFAELVQRYLGLVYHAASRQVGSHAHLAEDVAQTVFSRLAEKAPSLHSHSSLAGWLHTTTRFVARETLRAEHRRRVREQEAHLMNESFSTRGAGDDWEQLRPVIDEALGELSETDREAVLLRFFANRPLAEIGSTLNVSENTARMRIERALGKLQPALARRGVTSTGAALSLTLANHAIAATLPAGLAATISGTALITGGTAAAAGLLGFVSTTKFVSALTVTALLTLSVAVYEIRTARATEAALTIERRETVVLTARAEAAERQAKIAQQNLAQARATAANKSSAASAQPATPIVEDEGNGPMGPNPPGSRARGRAMLAAYPEIKELLVRDKRAGIAQRFSRLYQELGLSDAQIEGFELIMISGISTGIDMPISEPGKPLSAKTPLVSITMDAAPVLPKAEKEARLREVLGESGFKRMTEFQESPGDSRINVLASALYFTDTPLTPETGAKLQSVLIAHARDGKAFDPVTYWSAVQNDARAFLAAPQLEALRGLQAQDEFSYALPGNRRSQRTAQKDPAK